MGTQGGPVQLQKPTRDLLGTPLSFFPKEKSRALEEKPTTKERVFMEGMCREQDRENEPKIKERNTLEQRYVPTDLSFASSSSSLLFD